MTEATTTSTTVIHDTIAKWVEDLRTTRNDKNILAFREKGIRGDILAEVGEVAQELVNSHGTVVAEVVVYEQRKMDWDLLAKKYPEAYAECVSFGEVVRLDTK